VSGTTTVSATIPTTTTASSASGVTLSYLVGIMLIGLAL
jgi:hypothetical protein